MIDRPTPINTPADELRDPHLDALWHALPAQEPSATLDAALRAAARREAAAAPHGGAPGVAEATRPERWWWPLAAAATIGAIAIGVLQLVPDQPNERDVVSDMPRTPGARSDAAKSAPASVPDARESRATAQTEAVPSSEQALRKGTRRAEKNPRPALDARPADPASTHDERPGATGEALSKPSASTGASLPSPTPATPTPLRADAPTAAAAAPDQAGRISDARTPLARAETAAGAAPRQREADGAAPYSLPPAKVGAARDSSERVVSERATRPVAEWIALIRRLRDEGATDQAFRELAAFRDAHPDAERLLPLDLRDWRPPKPSRD